jgi:2-oxoglutarate ferredoxin oxidoreductase subunit alpha
VPAPEVYQAENTNEYGMIFYGTTTQTALEALDYLAADGVKIDALRVKAFPFNETVEAFIRAHKKVFVVEQNRDAQMRSLLVNDCGFAPSQLVPVLNYDGMAITAAFIQAKVVEYFNPAKNVTALNATAEDA